jgi:fructose-1,6-bisphosphatase-3
LPVRCLTVIPKLPFLFSLLHLFFENSLLPLASYAIETYGNDPCEQFMPQGFNQPDDSERERRLMARMHKTITIIQFKLEARIIRRRAF